MVTTLTSPQPTATPGATTMPRIHRIVVADDHPLYRSGIVAALERYGGFDVVGEAADGARALELIRSLEPDIAVLDVRMPELDGVDVVHALALHGPDVPIVMLSAFSDAELVDSALFAGAAAYCNKGEDRDVLCERLAAIAGVGRALAPSHLSPHDPIVRSDRWLPRFTQPEHQLLQLAGAGLDKPAIQQAMSISEAAMRIRVAGILRKLDCDSLAEGVDRARSHGLIR